VSTSRKVTRRVRLCHTAASLLTHVWFQNSVLRGASIAATSQVRDVFITPADHGWMLCACVLPTDMHTRPSAVLRNSNSASHCPKTTRLLTSTSYSFSKVNAYSGSDVKWRTFETIKSVLCVTINYSPSLSSVHSVGHSQTYPSFHGLFQPLRSLRSVDSEGFWRWCITHRFTGFYSTNGTSGRYYMSSQIFPFLCNGAIALDFVGYVCSKNFYLLFHPSSTHVRALSQFYCVFSCYLTPN
jgi:hypothetical protein